MIRARALVFSATVVAFVTGFLACNPPITGAPCPDGQHQCPTGQVCTPQRTCEMPPGAGGGAGGSGGGTGGMGGGGGAGGTGGTGGAGGGSAKKPDGQACLTANECQSNVCTAFYNDDDGDGFGRPPMSGSQPRLCGTTPPQFYSTTSNDCCDADKDVYPGQMGWFDVPRNSACMGGTNPFDYDCSMAAEPEPLTVRNCEPPPPGCNICAAGKGWAKPDAPDCGVPDDQVTAVGQDSGIDDAGCRYTNNTITPMVKARCH